LKLTNTKKTSNRERERQRESERERSEGENNEHKCRMQERRIQTKNKCVKKETTFSGRMKTKGAPHCSTFYLARVWKRETRDNKNWI
jgi:hypothetical protein